MGKLVQMPHVSRPLSDKGVYKLAEALAASLARRKKLGELNDDGALLLENLEDIKKRQPKHRNKSKVVEIPKSVG